MIRLVPYIGAAAVAAYLSWSATDYRLKSEVARINAEHSRLIERVSLAMTAEISKARARAKELRLELVAIDERHTKELQHAKQESAALRDAVDDGTKRLHVATQGTTRASCPSVPGSTSDTVVGDGAGAELDGQARRAYFDLRSGVDSAMAKLSACQSILIKLTKEDGSGDGYARTID